MLLNFAKESLTIYLNKVSKNALSKVEVKNDLHKLTLSKTGYKIQACHGRQKRRPWPPGFRNL